MTQSFQPEWAPIKAVLLAWPFPSGAWCDNYDQVVRCYWDMLTAISQAAPVWLLCHPSIDIGALEQGIRERGIMSDRVQLIGDISYDDTWIRDYGPLSLSDGYVTYTFNGWGGKYDAAGDDCVAGQLSPWLGQRPLNLAFVCEGGALETNGRDLLVNADCLVNENRNPGVSRVEVEARLRRDLGVERVLWLQNAVLTGDDTDGHIDTIARFADSTTLVYAGRNELHVDALVLSELHEQVRALAERNNWRAFELPTPSYSSLLDGRWLPCTYANFLIANSHVFAPTYGLPEDAEALSVLRQAFAGYNVVPVRCEALLEQHGSLHCATMQIAEIN